MAKVILITSGKGGAGKTTTAINLSHALYNYGRRVVLIDFNLYSGDITLHLGAFRTDKTIHDFLSEDADIKDLLYMHESGITFIPASLSIDKTSNIKEEESVAKLRKIVDFLNGRTELIIIDAGLIFLDYVQQLLKLVKEVIIVTTPDKESVVNTLKASKIVEKNNKKILGVVVNKRKGNVIEMKREEIESFVEKPVIVEIPHDEEVKYSQKLEFPVTHYKPDAESSLKFKELAAKIIGEKYVQNKEKDNGKSLFRRILQKLGLSK